MKNIILEILNSKRLLSDHIEILEQLLYDLHENIEQKSKTTYCIWHFVPIFTTTITSSLLLRQRYKTIYNIFPHFKKMFSFLDIQFLNILHRLCWVDMWHFVLAVLLKISNKNNVTNKLVYLFDELLILIFQFDEIWHILRNQLYLNNI